MTRVARWPWVLTLGLAALVVVAALLAANAGFLPVLFAWPILAALVGLPTVLLLLRGIGRRRQASTFQGELAWLRQVERRARLKGQAPPANASGRRIPSAAELQRMDDDA